MNEEILVKFIHIDNLYRIKNSKGKRLEELAEILLEEEKWHLFPSCEIEFHRYIGDFALFIVGIFPESLRRRVKRTRISKDEIFTQIGSILAPCKDTYEYYIHKGSWAYSEVYRKLLKKNLEEGEVFKKLSQHFKEYIKIMSLVRTYLDTLKEFSPFKEVLEN